VPDKKESTGGQFFLTPPKKRECSQKIIPQKNLYPVQKTGGIIFPITARNSKNIRCFYLSGSIFLYRNNRWSFYGGGKTFRRQLLI